ncbi:hypothetical protein SAMN02745136_04332 [Anaerocolumna jejuensis DSM 15929]|uniref:Uncharacterized protein n=1 Tax=Anaerocolumna jejuensis DSM 15929 TaxID=1121322 RepID=A0A1M6YPA4_9FIRM|nr:hypothetical protein SAMN02745136_04332 [Anaerocolumna jejuensis DSM 15929]
MGIKWIYNVIICKLPKFWLTNQLKNTAFNAYAVFLIPSRSK